MKINLPFYIFQMNNVTAQEFADTLTTLQMFKFFVLKVWTDEVYFYERRHYKFLETRRERSRRIQHRFFIDIWREIFSGHFLQLQEFNNRMIANSYRNFHLYNLLEDTRYTSNKMVHFLTMTDLWHSSWIIILIIDGFISLVLRWSPRSLI